LIGLTGAHRVGKTTLAREFAKQEGYTFIETSASRSMLAAGFDPARDYTLVQRLDAQRAVLEGLVAAYRAAPARFITDRTPIDSAAYLLADVTRENAGPMLQGEIMEYVSDCIEATNRYFAVLVLVQPGIRLVGEAGKAPAEPAYQDHIHNLIGGLSTDERLTVRNFRVPRRYLELQTRIKAVRQTVDRALDRMAAEVEVHVAGGASVQ
jgi:hypothetical protein